MKGRIVFDYYPQSKGFHLVRTYVPKQPTNEHFRQIRHLYGINVIEYDALINLAILSSFERVMSYDLP